MVLVHQGSNKKPPQDLTPERAFKLKPATMISEKHQIIII